MFENWATMDALQKATFVGVCLAVLIVCYGIVWTVTELKRHGGKF